MVTVGRVDTTYTLGTPWMAFWKNKNYLTRIKITIVIGRSVCSRHMN